ncbi:MAG: MerR family transcriptional regulator [Acetobacter sp.]|uniref:MerR family transcriptional regulator n=1 Tax=Acetobacter sp. TaxID=440 RepID=UPI0039EA4881
MTDQTDLQQAVTELSSPDSGDDSFDSTRLEKGPLAFRTISEVADELHVPQHTLRLWETQFEAVRPLKRGGGRRYYRPDDVELLRRIADMLYTQGYTVKGVQRLLREGGVVLDMPDATAESEDGNAALVAEAAYPVPQPLQDALTDGDVAQPVFNTPDNAAVAEFQPSAGVAPLAAGCDELRQELQDILVELQAIREKLVI